MRLAWKLSLLLALASAGPLLLATGVTVPRAGSALKAQLDALYQSSTRSQARAFEARIEGSSTALGTFARHVSFAELLDDGGDAEEAVERALQLLSAQVPDATLAALVDASGVPVGAPVSAPGAPAQGGPGAAAALEAFAAHAPYREVLSAGTALFGPLYASPGDGLPRVVVGAPALSPPGEQWVLLVELSLSRAVAQLGELRPGQTGVAMLLDARGAPVWSAQGGPAGGERIEARASLGRTGWAVVVSQDAEEALGAVRRQSREAGLWALVGLALAAVLGFVAVRVVTRPLGVLERAAQQVERGDLSTEVKLRGRDELARVGAAFNGMVQGLRERERLRRSFDRYLSGAVAERILRETDDLEVAGEQVEVTILFLDIRGFTSLSERLAPAQVVELLNAYFERVVAAVMRHEGVVMKFIGDAVMVMFGVPRQLPDPEQRAVRTALEIQAEVAVFNLERAAQHLPVAVFGAGINTGPAVVGNVGSRLRMEYTAIGDAVNLAERLQGLAGPGEVVVSASTRARLGAAFDAQAQDLIRVKGKAEPVQVYRVLGEAPPPVATREA